MRITNDSKNPTGNGSTFKSGYGINQLVNVNINSNKVQQLPIHKMLYPIFQNLDMKLIGDYWIKHLMAQVQSLNLRKIIIQLIKIVPTSLLYGCPMEHIQ